MLEADDTAADREILNFCACGIGEVDYAARADRKVLGFARSFGIPDGSIAKEDFHAVGFIRDPARER